MSAGVVAAHYVAAAAPGGLTTYDGTFGTTVTLDLGATNAATIVWDMEDTQPGQDTKVFLEYSTNFNPNAGLLFISYAAGYALALSAGNNSNYYDVRFARPGTGVHHYVLVFDRAATPTANQIRFFIDGVKQSPTSTAVNNSMGGTNFAASKNLYVMSRASTSLFAKGRANVPTVYTYAMTDAQAAAA